MFQAIYFIAFFELLTDEGHKMKQKELRESQWHFIQNLK